MSTKQTRRRLSGEFKFKVVLEALKERHSLAELSQEYEVSQVMISDHRIFLGSSSLRIRFGETKSPYGNEDLP